MNGIAKHWWVIAVAASLSAHLALAVTVPPPTGGTSEPPAGPPVSVTGSLASILGSAAATEPLAPVSAETAPAAQTDPRPTPPRQAATLPHITPAATPPPLTPHSRTAPVVPLEPRTASAAPIAPVAPVSPVKPDQAEATTAPRPQSQPAEPGVVLPARAPDPAARPPQRKPDEQAATEQRERQTEKRIPPRRKPSERKRRRTEKRSRAGSNRQGAASASDGGRRGTSRASNGAIQSYGARVRARILANRPAASGTGRTIVSFALSPGGALRYARLARSSGNGELDRAALTAVRRAAPFPNPPVGASPSQLSFSISFRFR